jgi:D-3-phosphoglycerate dehydrogenase
MCKVVLTDYAWLDLTLEQEILEKGGAELIAKHCSTEFDVIAATVEADAIITEYAPITRAAIFAAKKCKVISMNAAGYDNVDVAAATEAGVMVTNVPDYCYEEVADHAMALILACARRVVSFCQNISCKIWDFKSTGQIKRIRGQTLGLIGFGGVSRNVARRAKPFGMSIIAYDPYLPPEVFEQEGVSQVSLEKLLTDSDFVSVHIPKTPETVGLISEKQLGMMKPHSFLINTSRGGIVDETALNETLKCGRIEGAALDVLAVEPADFSNPLFELENAVITPHCAFYSEDAMIEVRTRAAEQVLKVFAGEWPPNLVNRELRGRTDLRAGIVKD